MYIARVCEHFHCTPPVARTLDPFEVREIFDALAAERLGDSIKEPGDMAKLSESEAEFYQELLAAKDPD